VIANSTPIDSYVFRIESVVTSPTSDSHRRPSARPHTSERRISTVELRRLPESAYGVLILDWNMRDGTGSRIYTNLPRCAEGATEADSCLRPTAGEAAHVQWDSIGPVAYTARGGVFEFDVRTHRGTFNFKIARTRYDAADGGVYVQGDVVLRDDGSDRAARRGSMKSTTAEPLGSLTR